MAIDVLDHAGNFAAPERVKMGEGSRHGAASGPEGSGIHAKGGDLVALFDVMTCLGAIVDPFGRKALKHVGDDRLRADVGAGVREARRLGPFDVRCERAEEARGILALEAFIGGPQESEIGAHAINPISLVLIAASQMDTAGTGPRLA
jgi:hypothetical protein